MRAVRGGLASGEDVAREELWVGGRKTIARPGVAPGFGYEPMLGRPERAIDQPVKAYRLEPSVLPKRNVVC
jgi:hypothetical protein